MKYLHSCRLILTINKNWGSFVESESKRWFIKATVVGNRDCARYIRSRITIINCIFKTNSSIHADRWNCSDRLPNRILFKGKETVRAGGINWLRVKYTVIFSLCWNFDSQFRWMRRRSRMDDRHFRNAMG